MDRMNRRRVDMGLAHRIPHGKQNDWQSMWKLYNSKCINISPPKRFAILTILARQEYDIELHSVDILYDVDHWVTRDRHCNLYASSPLI